MSQTEDFLKQLLREHLNTPADAEIDLSGVHVEAVHKQEAIQDETAMISKQVQAIPTPCSGYRIHGDVWLRFGNELELVARSLDEEITGDDAVRFASMTDEEMYQAVINLYMNGDIDDDEHVAYTGDCPPAKVEVEAITSPRPVKRQKPGKPGMPFFKQK